MNKNFNLTNFIKEYITERKESLLAKDLKSYHNELAKRINRKSVLVIGGAGTIGSSFIKALLKFEPSKLYVVDINENGLAELVRDLRSSGDYNIPMELKLYPINFSDKVFEKLIIGEGPFDIVANFAAHKHVRSEKDQYSVEAMVENNVLKTKKLLNQLLENPPERFFCVSTDKAANPVNIMGASKKLMEEVIMAYSKKMHITTARFANVAFSNGSLPDAFLKRIEKRQPLSAPSDVIRYFVSPEESGQICLLACLLGDSGNIFFPKLTKQDMKTFSYIGEKLLQEMGYKVAFASSENEAKRIIKNRSANNDYPVLFSPSSTSGEKPFEEFYTENEEIDLKTFSKLGIIKNKAQKSFSEIEKIFEKLYALFDQQEVTKAEIVKVLSGMITNFSHIETGENLDQKM